MAASTFSRQTNDSDYSFYGEPFDTEETFGFKPISFEEYLRRNGWEGGKEMPAYIPGWAKAAALKQSQLPDTPSVAITPDQADNDQPQLIMASTTERKGYLIAVSKITDMERFTNEYIPVSAETLAEYDAEILVASFDPEVIEGEWDHTVTTVVEFPSVETAKEWYNDEAYQKVKQVRDDACEYTNRIITSSFSSEQLE